MCGIFGVLNLEGLLDYDQIPVEKLTELLKHRGPDDEGHYKGAEIYLGHRRLSIIDLGTGKQPIYNEDGTQCVVFNGEIYNFREIRKELEERGHHFKTKSDTEVIVHGYEEWGAACVEKFRGMFAFALWDEKEKQLFLGRDRLGIKPLFYALVDGVLYFASEMKSILGCKGFPRDIDLEGLASFFSLTYIPAPWTIFKHIRKLPPGHILEVRNGNISIKEYWDIYFQPDYIKTERTFIESVLGLLEEAIELRLISDVPLGAFLSGGIDSGAVVALMSRLCSEPVRSFCMGFGGEVGGYLDEREYARQVASNFGTIHNEYEVLPDIQGIIRDIVTAFDEPFADHSTIPSYYLCKITRQNVTVALSGLGGDELFGGYERYLGFKLSQYYNGIPHFLRENVIRKLIEKVPERRDGHYSVNHLKRFVRSASQPPDERYFGFINILHKDKKGSLFSDPSIYTKHFGACRELFHAKYNTENASDPMDRIFYTDMKTYLPEDILACADRMSMWHSLEVRVPFLDHKLLELCCTIPHSMKIRFGRKKHILKKGVSQFLPKKVVNHRKQGFVGPLSQWLQKDLRSYVTQILSDENMKNHDIFNKNAIKKVLNEHFNRVEIHDKLIWSLVIFQIWYNIYIEHENN